jgi:hypothetical protein
VPRVPSLSIAAHCALRKSRLCALSVLEGRRSKEKENKTTNDKNDNKRQISFKTKAAKATYSFSGACVFFSGKKYCFGTLHAEKRPKNAINQKVYKKKRTGFVSLKVVFFS